MECRVELADGKPKKKKKKRRDLESCRSLAEDKNKEADVRRA